MSTTGQLTAECITLKSIWTKCREVHHTARHSDSEGMVMSSVMQISLEQGPCCDSLQPAEWLHRQLAYYIPTFVLLIPPPDSRFLVYGTQREVNLLNPWFYMKPLVHDRFIKQQLTATYVPHRTSGNLVLYTFFPSIEFPLGLARLKDSVLGHL